MTEPARFVVGDVVLTRVPYFDVGLDPARVGLTDEFVAGLPWRSPAWTDPAGRVLVGQVVWVLESEDRVIVVDPCGAADAFLRTGSGAIGHQEAVLAAMAAAGFPPEAVDVVVLSHLDGIGMTGVVDIDGRWAPAFPAARIAITARELAFLAGRDDVSGHDAFRQLIDQGAVDGVADDHPLTGEVVLRHTGGHTPGHAVVEVASGGQRATLLGHLAVTPLQLAAGPLAGAHEDPEAADQALHEVVEGAVADGGLIIGPLWPAPGAGRAAAGGTQIVPVEPLPFPGPSASP